MDTTMLFKDVTMGALKRYMHDVYDHAFAYGLKAAAEKFSTTVEDVKNTIMAWDGFDINYHTWEDYVEHMSGQPNGPDDVSGEGFIPTD